jgi:hypothetical protein
LTCTEDAGLLLKPTRKWDGTRDFKFCIIGYSDADYAKDMQTRYSISGYVVYLEGAPAMSRSATQEYVALLSVESEGKAAVQCAQDMIYANKNVLESLGLEIELSMVMQVDNKGTVDAVNGYSVGVRMRHVNIKQCFLRELKEAKVLIVKWIPGSENQADMFTKNLDGPLFKQYTKLLLGE